MTKVNIRKLASVIRSKNSGPFELTLDIMFKTPEIYQMVKDKKVFTKELIASLYQIPIEKVLNLVEFDPAYAIKATIVRPRVAGDLEETDIYGAQQHGPLLYIDIECDQEL
jgi:hypothetical protein